MALPLIIFFLLPILSAGQVLPYDAFPVCSLIKCNASITYQENLNQLFLYLHANASLSGFHTATAGQGRDQSYGLALCRPDIPRSNCSDCILQAIEVSNRTCCSYYSWYDYCLLRYSTQNFIGEMDNTVSIFSESGSLVLEPALFKQQLTLLMANLSSVAASNASGGLMFATGDIRLNASNNIYGLVMCTRDISFDSCRICLRGLIFHPGFFTRLSDGRFVTQSCGAMYSIDPSFMHLKVAAAPPPAAPASANHSPKETSGNGLDFQRIVFGLAGLAKVQADGPR
ncbi:Cysteine-rich repeat secretory protein 38 [Nymphaea thermarum]|nr:Cysteine-rich repeat secretory protein 38 [Nymphaea thermarum]